MGQISGGRFNRIDVGGVINIPIVEGKLKSSIAFSSKSRSAWQKRNPFPGAAGVASDPSEAFQQIDYTSRTAAGGISEQSIRGKLLWNATRRSEERRVGKECVSTGGSRGGPCH